MNKKSQVWILDFIVGMLFFTTALIVFFKYTPNLYSRIDISDLLNDAKSLSDKIIGSGEPYDWEKLNLSSEENMSKVIYFGITNDNFIVNDSKLNSLVEITNSNYDEVRLKQGLKYNFFVELIQANTTEVSFGYNFTPEYSTIKNIVKIDRIVILNNTITKLRIIVFEK